MDVYLGQITLMAITYAPSGWHACDGSILQIAQNSALFALIGTTYGGNGTQTFALPDLRGRVPVCAGSGPGLQPYVLGQKSGTETVSLTTQNLASHTHSAALQVVAAGKGASSPVAGNYLETSTTIPPGTSPTLVALGGVPVQPAGNGVPFSILQPYLALNYYIALQGIFPTRN